MSRTADIGERQPYDGLSYRTRLRAYQPPNPHMTRRFTILVVAMSVGVADARAQHEGHGGPSLATATGANPACAEAGQKTLAILEAASPRVAEARGASSVFDLHAAIAALQVAVGAAQAELFTCRAAVPAASPVTPAPVAMAGMDHSKNPAQPGVTPASSMAGMDHSKMNMGKPAPGAPSAKPGAKPAAPMAGMDHSKMNMGKPASGAPAAKPGAKSVAPTAGMDHSKVALGGATRDRETAAATAGGGMLPVGMAERIADPACPDNLGQATAPKAVHDRRVYYFCSIKARDEFRKDPAAYLKKYPRQ